MNPIPDYVDCLDAENMLIYRPINPKSLHSDDDDDKEANPQQNGLVINEAGTSAQVAVDTISANTTEEAPLSSQSTPTLPWFPNTDVVAVKEMPKKGNRKRLTSSSSSVKSSNQKRPKHLEDPTNPNISPGQQKSIKKAINCKKFRERQKQETETLQQLNKIQEEKLKEKQELLEIKEYENQQLSREIQQLKDQLAKAEAEKSLMIRSNNLLAQMLAKMIQKREEMNTATDSICLEFDHPMDSVDEIYSSLWTNE